MVFGPKFRYFFQQNETRDEAKTSWLVCVGPMLHHPFFFALESRDSHWYRQPLLILFQQLMVYI